jgi:hypothetical protein
MEATDLDGLDWKLSSFSSNGGASCVAVAHHDSVVYVRNSNNPGAGTVAFNHAEWDAFVKGVKHQEFDLDNLSS